MYNKQSHSSPSPPITDTSLAIAVCCYVLAEYFKVALLPHEALARVKLHLTAESAVLLVQFADRIQSQLLRDICMECLKLSGHTSGSS